MHPCQMCDTFCTQIRSFVLTKWRQMHEPPKNNLGCNAWFLKALQPNCRIMLRYALVFQTGLRRGYAGDGHTEWWAAYVVHA